MQNNYDIYKGKELEIADLIQRRRLQLLVHSCLYYELDTNLISDKTWDSWAKELVQLQTEYPEISKTVMWYESFSDWDASTGAFLPIKDKWVVNKAKTLMGVKGAIKPKPAKTVVKGKFSLF